jgi:hypothetical protein
MEGLLFLGDVFLMIVLVVSVMRAERPRAKKDGEPNLGFFSYRERPKGQD